MKSPALSPRPCAYPRHLVWLCLLWCALLLSCGGGQDQAGVGTGGTGLKEGNVSGFGSVFIDGVRYDNSQATVTVADGSGEMVSGQLKLGQRVRAVFNSAGQISSVELLPALLGVVLQAPDVQGYFLVMGQWVRFVSKALPYRDTLSSSTYLGGYSSFTDIAEDDVVEVHGVWDEADPLKGRVLVASRIEKAAAPPTRMLLTGTVSAVNPAGNTFALQTADGRRVLAASAGAALGDWVKVWVDSVGVQAWRHAGQPGSAVLNATYWSAASLATSQSPVGGSVEISGLPAQFDAVSNRVTVQGMTVRLQPDSLSSATRAALQAGTFTRFTLRLDAPSGVWAVESITPREGDSLGGITAVVGKGTSVVAVGSGGVVRLNGVDVAIDPDVLQLSNCPSLNPQDAVTVAVTGSPVGEVVQAHTLVCSP